MKRSKGHKRKLIDSSKEVVIQTELYDEVIVYHNDILKDSVVRGSKEPGYNPRDPNTSGPIDSIMELTLVDLDHSHISDSEFQRLQNCYSMNNCTKAEFNIISYFNSVM